MPAPNALDSVETARQRRGSRPDGEQRFAGRSDWLLIYLGVACCVVIAVAAILVAAGVL